MKRGDTDETEAPRCEQALKLRAPGETHKGEQGGRCPKQATHYLLNGSQINGRACAACAQQLVADFPFLSLRPINS